MAEDREERLRRALHDAVADLSEGVDPLDLVADILVVEDFAADLAVARVAHARLAGAPWEEIARRLGVSRQAVHKRFASSTTLRRRRGPRLLELRIQREPR